MAGFYVFKYSLYAIIYAGIIICGIINQRYIETATLFVSFILLRYAFPKTFHHKNVYWCVFWSITIFAVAIPHTLPITISIFSSVIIGFAMTWLLYKIEDYFNAKEFVLKYNITSLDNISEERLFEICHKLHYKQDKINLAKMFFIDKWDNNQVWQWLCNNQLNVEYDTVIKYRYRITKDLKKFIKEE